MSFKFVCADPLSRGLGALGPGFHPIWFVSLISSSFHKEKRGKGTYHEDNLECGWYTAIFFSIHFWISAHGLLLFIYPPPFTLPPRPYLQFHSCRLYAGYFFITSRLHSSLTLHQFSPLPSMGLSPSRYRSLVLTFINPLSSQQYIPTDPSPPS